jgi:signal transduction histidine kinase
LISGDTYVLLELDKNEGNRVLRSQEDTLQKSALWFIPATLACIFVLSGLCLFFIQRQSRAEESQLREQERFCLEKTQRLFREVLLQEKWQNAISTLPAPPLRLNELRAWDHNLGEGVFGFSLDNSGMLFYPSYQVYPQPLEISPALGQAITESLLDLSVEHKTQGTKTSLDFEDYQRRLLAAIEKKDREKVVILARLILSEAMDSRFPGGQAAAMKATEALLQFEEITNKSIESHGKLVDAWLDAIARGDVPLSPPILPWIESLQDQCRRRDGRESWVAREKQFARLAQQTHWAEKFVYRLNLVLRRNLYNTTRTQLPTRFLGSDPNDEPYVVMFRFVDHSELSLIGVAVDLDIFSARLQSIVARASWLPEELAVSIRKNAAPSVSDFQEASLAGGAQQELDPKKGSTAVPESQHRIRTEDSSKELTEQGILDPLAPQFMIEVMPRNPASFRQKTVRKNFLYLTIVLLAIGTSILVLFFGQRSIKEQHRLSKLRADFLTNVSHELRTPLTAIRLHAETLERQLKGANQSAGSNLETIVAEVDRLSLLINDVLEFTRLENDKKRFVWERVDLVPVIKESYQLFWQQLEESNFEVELELPESLILQRADRAALKQCAVNLISNSLKYSGQEKFLGIRLKQDNGFAIWEVEDHGIGIPMEERPHVFDKFYRGKGLDPALSGTGLGLTLCKAFVEAHGGLITLRDLPLDHGAIFVMQLPMSQPMET